MRFLFDAHVHRGACARLRERGLDVVHAADRDLGGAPDHVLFEAAVDEDRIVVTRDVADFAALVEAYGRAGREHPGVLFLSRSIPPADVGAHVHALEAWVEASGEAGNPIRNAYGWLTARERASGDASEE